MSIAQGQYDDSEQSEPEARGPRRRSFLRTQREAKVSLEQEKDEDFIRKMYIEHWFAARSNREYDELEVKPLWSRFYRVTAYKFARRKDTDVRLEREFVASAFVTYFNGESIMEGMHNSIPKEYSHARES